MSEASLVLDFFCSEKLDKFNEAWLKFSSLGLSVQKLGENPHFHSSYAKLPDVLDVLQKPLVDCGFIVFQLPLGGVDIHRLFMRITHAASGQYIQWIYSTPVSKKDPQGFASANTYAKRINLVSPFGLAEVDDDGNEASSKAKQDSKPAPAQPPASNKPAKPAIVEPIYGPKDNQQKIEFATIAVGCGIDGANESMLREVSDHCKGTPMKDLKAKILKYINDPVGAK